MQLIVKVLHVITGLKAGGAEAVLFQLVTADPTNQHIVVSMGTHGAYGQKLIEKGVRVVELRMSKGLSTVTGLWKLFSLIKRETPDVVQTWMYHADVIGGVIARLAGRKAICWGIHNSNLSANVVSFPTRMVVKVASRLSHFLPKKIISVSIFASHIHIQEGYTETKIEVIPNGYDMSAFKPSATKRQEFRAALNLQATSMLLGMVARWHPVKDHNNLFTALSRLNNDHDWHLLLVGESITEDNDELTTMLREYGLLSRCTMLGQRDDVSAILTALDIHILSSAGEAFPNAIAEAMACGVPCVTTDVGDAALIIDGTGRLVPDSDSDALCQAVSSLLAEIARLSLAERDELRGLLHAKIADRFSSEVMVQNYNAVWKKSINQAT